MLEAYVPDYQSMDEDLPCDCSENTLNIKAKNITFNFMIFAFYTIRLMILTLP